MQLMSVSAAARHLGYKSRSQLYKLMNDGWLDAHVHIQMPSGQRLLDVDGLQKTLQGLCQWRVDSISLGVNDRAAGVWDYFCSSSKR